MRAGVLGKMIGVYLGDFITVPVDGGPVVRTLERIVRGFYYLWRDVVRLPTELSVEKDAALLRGCRLHRSADSTHADRAGGAMNFPNNISLLIRIIKPHYPSNSLSVYTLG